MTAAAAGAGASTSPAKATSRAGGDSSATANGGAAGGGAGGDDGSVDVDLKDAVITSASYNAVAPFVGKYISLLEALPIVAPDGFAALQQFAGFYFYHIFKTFVPGDAQEDLFAAPDADTNNAAWRHPALREEMRRIAEEFGHKPRSSVSTSAAAARRLMAHEAQTAAAEAKAAAASVASASAASVSAAAQEAAGEDGEDGEGGGSDGETKEGTGGGATGEGRGAGAGVAGVSFAADGVVGDGGASPLPPMPPAVVGGLAFSPPPPPSGARTCRTSSQTLEDVESTSTLFALGKRCVAIESAKFVLALLRQVRRRLEGALTQSVDHAVASGTMMEAATAAAKKRYLAMVDEYVV